MVNFINILRVAFTCADPESAKKTVFFTLLGSAYAKAECRMLMKLTPSFILIVTKRVDLITELFQSIFEWEKDDIR